MSDISRLARMFQGAARGIDLTSNTLVVLSIKVGGGVSNTELTKTILDKLINLQNGTDFSDGTNSHTHDGRYRTETELASNANGEGASFIGIEDAGSKFAGTTVEAALQEVGADAVDLRTLSGTADGDTHLGTFTGTTIPDSSTIKGALQALESAHETTDGKVSNLITLSGVAANATHLGTFSGAIIPDSSTVKGALQSLETDLENAKSLIQNFEWQPSVLGQTATPPGSPSTGDRYLVIATGTGDFTGQENKIAEWNGAAWVFVTPTIGMFTSDDTLNDRLLLWTGSAWVAKYFEATTASQGLTKVGFDIRLSNANSGGINIASGVVSVNTDDSTIEKGAGAGNPLQVKDLGITNGKIANDTITNAKINSAAAIDYSKLADLAAANKVLQSNGSSKVSASSVDIASVVSLTDGSNADALHSHAKIAESIVVGEGMAANSTFAVRLAKNGETAGRFYKADKDTTSADNFHVIGLIRVGGTALNAGDAAVMVKIGALTVGSDFLAADLGLPVFLDAAGAISLTPPSADLMAITKVGIVRATNQIEVQIQVMGVN